MRANEPRPRVTRQQARPRVEELHGVCAGLELRVHVLDDQVGQFREQHVDQCRIGGGQRAQCRESGAAAPLHEIRGDRPRRAREPEQRALAVQLVLHDAQSAHHRRRDLLARRCAQRRDVRRGAHRMRQHRAGREFHFEAQRRDRTHEIGEDDRGVERKPCERLQRDLCGELGVAGQFFERVTFAERPVFRQVAAGLPHHPQRAAGGGLAGDRIEKEFPTGCDDGRGGAHASGSAEAVNR